jgi:hypothetical protein
VQLSRGSSSDGRCPLQRMSPAAEAAAAAAAVLTKQRLAYRAPHGLCRMRNGNCLATAAAAEAPLVG